ncbi:putative pyruvate kinase [Helianthus annuus]|nr:putative pyruvate kinase [Helianthus annuus]
MKFGAASLGPITNHASYCGTNPTEALLLRDKPLHLSCGLDAKILVSRGKMFQGLRRHKQAFSLTFIVSAIRNGKDEHESIIGAYSDDQSLTISKSSHKANDTTKESVASSLYLSEDHSQHAKILENHGNLLDKLKAIHMHALAMEQWNASRLKQCHRRHAMSAANLIHYLALRSLDVDQIKDDLSSVGLLNLETINPYVIASLSAGIQMLENLKSTSLDGNDKGATIIRINCAHGDPSVWSEIIRRVKMNSQMLEKPCRILMDLAGPKLRTGKMKPGPCVLKISPKKNAHGNMINPAHVWIAPKGAGPPPSHVSPDAVLYVDAQDFLTKLEIGDTIKFSDARGKKRSLKISKKFPVFNGVGFMADCTKTCYVENGMELYIKANKKRASFGCVVDVPPTETFVRLRVGDLLVITRDSSNEELTSSKAGTPRVTCSSGYLFDSVKPGEPIAFDDGKIWGVIKGTSISEIVVSITRAGPRGTKLGPEKSINIPESKIQYEGLTSKDIVDLEFVGSHADIVGISFVRNVNDIVVLEQELKKRKLEHLGIVLKIETKDGLKNLAVMILEAMKLPNPLGIMIARGDLAVECGWEQMADIQEQILSICSAAHVPVIWATQVLESLVKTGVPTRAEITDVACGRRASCIMLNKGKHILEAIATLDTILKSSSSTKVKAEVKPLVLSNRLS